MAQRVIARAVLAVALLWAPTARAQTTGGSEPTTTAPTSPALSADPAPATRSPSPPPTRTAATRTEQRRPAPRPTERREPDAEEDEEEEWGAFYIQLLGGYSFANLVQFRQDNFLPAAERVEGSGFFGGLGLGFRVHIVTIGAQATLASYAPLEDSGFELGTVIAAVALHLPVPTVQPYFRIGAGYAWMGKANYESPGVSDTDVFGFVIEGGFGVDIKLGRAVSIGVGLDAAYLNLGRQTASELGAIDDVSFEEDGDAVGLQLRGHAHLTFHI